jgi:hypothetical protein
VATVNLTTTGPKAPAEEIQANRFAAALLIDRRALQTEVSARFGDAGIRTLLSEMRSVPMGEQGRRVSGWQVGEPPALAPAFEVSVEAMAIAPPVMFAQ